MSRVAILKKVLRSKPIKTVGVLSASIALYLAMTVLTDNPVVGLCFSVMVSYYMIREYLIPWSYAQF